MVRQHTHQQWYDMFCCSKSQIVIRFCKRHTILLFIHWHLPRCVTVVAKLDWGLAIERSPSLVVLRGLLYRSLDGTYELIPVQGFQSQNILISVHRSVHPAMRDPMQRNSPSGCLRPTLPTDMWIYLHANSTQCGKTKNILNYWDTISVLYVY